MEWACKCSTSFYGCSLGVEESEECFEAGRESPCTHCRGRIRASSHVSKAARRHPSAPDRPATCGDCSGMPLWHIPAGGLRRGVDRRFPPPESPEAPGLPCQVAAGRPSPPPSTCNFRCGTNPTPLLESQHPAKDEKRPGSLLPQSAPIQKLLFYRPTLQHRNKVCIAAGSSTSLCTSSSGIRP